MGRYIGEAVANIGNTVTNFAAITSQERIAKMRDETARENAQLKADMQQTIAEIRAGKGGRRGGAAGDSEFNPMLAAAASGAENLPQFQGDLNYFKTGQAPAKPETQYTTDEAGNKVVNLGASSKDVVDQEKLAGIRSRAERTRSGIIAGSVDPQHLDQIEKARSEENLRRRAFDTNTDIGDFAKRVKALTGKDIYDVKDGTLVDTTTGDLMTTELGASKAQENLAQAGAAGALKTQRERYTDDDTRKERASLENTITQTDRIIKDYQKDIVFMSKAREPGSTEAQELADLRARSREAKDKLARITPDKMKTKEPSQPTNPPAVPRIRFDASGNRL